MEPRRRTLARAAVTVVTAVVLAACGGSSEPDATEVVAASSTKTLAAGSSKVAFSVASSAGGETAALEAEGAYDYEKKVGTLTLDLSQLGLAPSASGPAPDRAEIVLTEKVFYLRVPGAPGPKPWVKVDLEAQAKSAGTGLGGLEQLGGNDPTATLGLLGGASDDLQKVGTDKVRGTEATHYRGTLDLEKAVTAAPEAKRPELRKTIAELGNDKRLPVDVWIDDDGRVRKLVSKADSGTTTATVTVEYYDFGTRVTATVPPADQVADMPETQAQPPG